MEMQKQTLKDKITIVTGASRGIGKGIAEVLGENGATVFVTGRSTKEEETTENLPGTIEETARLVTDAGGKGIPVRCDHTHDHDVEELFRKIKEDYNRLDLLVNNVWGGYEYYDETFDAPFWEQPLYRWQGMFTAGLRAHFTASRLAASLMTTQKTGLIINISAGDEGKYLHSVMYDTAKAAIDRMAFGMAKELRKFNVAALSLYPGFTRTERVMEALEHAQDFDFNNTESPHYTGRAVAALATDSDIMNKSGKILTVGGLAKEYGFTDTDGRQPGAIKIPEYKE